MGYIKLSKRLEAITGEVPEGAVVFDVGCDHAHVPIRLLQEEKVPFAFGLDVAEGPLAIAETNLELAGLLERCELIRSDGLAAIDTEVLCGEWENRFGEAPRVLIMAGMGGILMERILGEDPDKTAFFDEMILSPQSEQWLVRELLCSLSIPIIDERMIEEDGKFYPVIHTGRPGETGKRPDWQKLADEAGNKQDPNAAAAAKLFAEPSFQRNAEMHYGPVLLKNFDPVLYQYIVRTLRTNLSVMSSLEDKMDTSENARERAAGLSAQIGILQVLLFMYTFLEPAR